jgi:uncharacterized repeat protein (TIGR03803 family)
MDEKMLTQMRYSGAGTSVARFRPAGLMLAVVLLAVPLLNAQTFNTLYMFTGGSDGALPNAGVVQDSAGDLYGTAGWGGDVTCQSTFNPPGCGSIYKITPAGVFTSIFSFESSNGINPSGPLVLGQDILGVASLGGDAFSGVAYALNRAGVQVALYEFPNQPGAAFPTGSLVRSPTGTAYGTSYFGGTAGQGTVYELVFNSSDGSKAQVVYSFQGGATDGENPNSGVVFQSNVAYGTTLYGGSGNCSNGQSTGCGVVFRLQGTRESVIHQFTGADGSTPGQLIPDGKGGFYGTTQSGGASGYGTVFEITANGTLTTLYSFSGSTDGNNPDNLVADVAGNLFGSTTLGGAQGAGVIFELSPNGKGGWSEKVLYSFNGTSDGRTPQPGLVVNSQTRTIYGATYEGGDLSCFAPNGCGTVFSITY